MEFRTILLIWLCVLTIMLTFNIILIFNNKAQADGSRYGIWDSTKDTLQTLLKNNTFLLMSLAKKNNMTEDEFIKYVKETQDDYYKLNFNKMHTSKILKFLQRGTRNKGILN